MNLACGNKSPATETTHVVRSLFAYDAGGIQPGRRLIAAVAFDGSDHDDRNTRMGSRPGKPRDQCRTRRGFNPNGRPGARSGIGLDGERPQNRGCNGDSNESAEDGVPHLNLQAAGECST